MRRRDFIATLGFATVSPWARDARAQAGAAGGALVSTQSRLNDAWSIKW